MTEPRTKVIQVKDESDSAYVSFLHMSFFNETHIPLDGQLCKIVSYDYERVGLIPSVTITYLPVSNYEA